MRVQEPSVTIAVKICKNPSEPQTVMKVTKISYYFSLFPFQGQKFVAVGAESRYLAFTATNRDI